MQQIQTQQDLVRGMRFLRNADPRLATIESQVPEIPLRLARPGFKGLANIIISQQVSKASASAISERFFDHIDPPNPSTYLCKGERVWIKIGLSRPKQKTFFHLCNAIQSGQLDLHDICDLPVDQALELLTAINGIGPWTAEVYLLFCAGHQDIFPAGDLALQEALRVLNKLEVRPNTKQAGMLARKWSPWRGVAARLLWAYYAFLKDGRDATPAIEK